MRARFGRGTGGVAPKRAEPEAGRPEAGATKSRPQTFTSRLSCVGHQGIVAYAFSEAHREKTDKVGLARRWTWSGRVYSPACGRRAKYTTPQARVRIA